MHHRASAVAAPSHARRPDEPAHKHALDLCPSPLDGQAVGDDERRRPARPQRRQHLLPHKRRHALLHLPLALAARRRKVVRVARDALHHLGLRRGHAVRLRALCLPQVTPHKLSCAPGGKPTPRLITV